MKKIENTLNSIPFSLDTEYYKDVKEKDFTDIYLTSMGIFFISLALVLLFVINTVS